MKFRRLVMALVSSLALAVIVNAQSPTSSAAPSGITGKIDIDFKADFEESPGVTNDYKMELTAVDTVIFGGKISHLPTKLSSLMGREKQQSVLKYDLGMSVANPTNLSQRRQVGKLVGEVPIDKNGTYQYDKGTLRAAVDAMGKASEFESRVRGQAAGKPPKDESMVARAKKDAIKLTRSVKGKNVALVVTDYDKMGFSGFVLPAGPSANYTEATVNGESLYDYEREAWYFRNLTMAYTQDGKQVTDKISGNIKWVPSPSYDSNGEGEYQFDVRVNEPEKKEAQGEAAVFATGDDESSFFEADATLPSLGGTMKYKDTLSGSEARSSAVTVNLTNNSLTKQQVVNLAKLILIASVVPMNSD